MPLKRFCDLEATGEQINNLIVDMTKIAESEEYNGFIVLKEGTNNNTKTRDYLEVGFKIWVGSETEHNELVENEEIDSTTFYYVWDDDE